jgi:hypothetical protein
MKPFPTGRPSLAALVLTAVVAVGATGASLTATGAPAGNAQAAGPLYEIRTYHIDPDGFPGYRTWASETGLAYLTEHLDVVGFWVDAGIEPEVRGAVTDPLGSGNVTWIIRWDSKEARDEGLAAAFETPEWQAVFAELPGGGENYVRIESRFVEALY